MPIRYAPDTTFDPAVAAMMGRAFEAAWSTLRERGELKLAEEREAWAKEMIALRIIDEAQRGERDPDRLRDDALTYLGQAISAPAAEQSRQASA